MSRRRRAWSTRWLRTTVWITNKWREMMEQKRLVLSITEREGVTVDPLHEVDNKHTGQGQQMYRSRTFLTRNDTSSILPHLTSKGKRESKKHEECEVQIRRGQRNSCKSFQYLVGMTKLIIHMIIRSKRRAKRV